jgi:branched-subunit amino acid ABC-type transport system permease component
MQTVIDGFLNAAPYALFGLAYSVMWSSMRLVNLAFPQVAAASALILWKCEGVMPIGLALAVAIVAGAAIGMVTHFVAIWPARNRPMLLIPLFASLGAGILLQGVLEQLAGPDQHPIDSGIPGYWFIGKSTVVRQVSAVWLAVTVVLFAAAILVLRNRRLGVSFRASAWAPHLAEPYGVNVKLVQNSAALAAALLAAVAGVSIACVQQVAGPYLGFDEGLKGIVAMLLGGGASVVGALLGAVTFGMAEAIGQYLIKGAGKDLLSYLLLFGVLLLRPQGLIKSNE